MNRTLLAASLGISLAVAPPTSADQAFRSDKADFRVETVAEGLEHPWGLAFLPDGSALVTEREGQLRHISNAGELSDPIPGLPELVVSGQGGLLDIVLHPDYQQNQTLFLSYAHRNGNGMTTRVAKATYDGERLTGTEVIFEALPRSSNGRHFAGRMVIDANRHLYIAVGDRGAMDRAQDTRDDAGGVHRLTLDGEPVSDNPFAGQSGKNDSFFTYGNRNIQGMALHPETGEVWSHEHGPRGGDEVNILRAGNNYGWPKVTYGIDYSGLPISSKTTMDGITDPLHYWDPSIAPSGMAFYSGDRFPAWQGDLFVGALKFQKLVRLSLDGETVTEEEDLLTDFGKRIRDVRMGPDGALWLLTDSGNGGVYRLVPAD